MTPTDQALETLFRAGIDSEPADEGRHKIYLDDDEYLALAELVTTTEWADARAHAAAELNRATT